MFVAGCKKSSDVVNQPNPTNPTAPTNPNPNPSVGPDLSTKVYASVSGFVVNENNNYVSNAEVSAGTSTTFTDKYGYFEINNVQVVQNAATVTVSLPGYFTSIKTWIAKANKSAFFRITLVPKTNIGSIDASAGGQVTLPGGMQISLPANAVVVASTAATYSGTVHFSGFWYDPTSPVLNNQMPGDLRGIDINGKLKALETFGMVEVEMKGNSGEILQIKTGQTATLTAPIPSVLMAHAPSTIPLWYFDETKGLWLEQSSATKSGDHYVGQVSHFSSWNLDNAYDYIQVEGILVDSAGGPVQNALIKISEGAQPNNITNAYTTPEGYFSGRVPANTNLLLEVISDFGCSNALYTKILNPSATNISVGSITLAATMANVTGSVNDCIGQATTNGYLIVNRGGLNFRLPISSDGSYDFSIPLCGTSNVINLIAEDIAAGQQSFPINYVLSPGANAMGILTACGVPTGEFLTYRVNGGVVHLVESPFDVVSLQNLGGNISEINADIYSGHPDPYNTHMKFDFDATGMGLNTMQPITWLGSVQVGQVQNFVIPVRIQITEYGPIGGFVSGNFGGTLINIYGTSFNVNCSFRVRRNF